MDNVGDSVDDARVLFCGLAVVLKVIMGLFVCTLPLHFGGMVFTHNGVRVHLDVVDVITGR